MTALKHALPITCVIVAGVVAMSGNDGWGWFLFLAFILSGAI